MNHRLDIEVLTKTDIGPPPDGKTVSAPKLEQSEPLHLSDINPLLHTPRRFCNCTTTIR
jgi:hypothetical protein